MRGHPRGRVLVVDHDTRLSRLVTDHLIADGYAAEAVHDGFTGLDRAVEGAPDVVVLDPAVPGLPGGEVMARLRRVAAVPVIIVSDRVTAEDRIAGLLMGADDYVTKPLAMRELVLRVDAVVRRSRGCGGGGSLLRAGALEVDTAARLVRRDGVDVGLTVREFELLAHLMRRPGRALRRQELLEEVWGYSWGDVSTVTVTVRRLREKIEPDVTRPHYVRTVRGVGYMFLAPGVNDIATNDRGELPRLAG